MQKIFINIETNMVEQILKEEEGEIIGENYFSNCYMIEDHEEIINGYNVRYNKEEERFEILGGLQAKDEVEIIPSEIEKMKLENETLKKEIQEIKNMITQTFMKE